MENLYNYEGIEIDSKLSQKIIERACNVLKEITDIDVKLLNQPCNKTLLILADKIKNFSDENNCVISSWVRGGVAHAECYNASTYEEEDDNSWGLLVAPTEAEVVIASFMWLYDRGNFTPTFTKYIQKEIG